jgi:hypothetical protein
MYVIFMTVKAKQLTFCNKNVACYDISKRIPFFQYEGSFKVGVGVSERVCDHSFALLTINSLLI